MEVERTEINKHVFAQVHIYYNHGPQNWFKMKAHTGLVEFIRGESVWFSLVGPFTNNCPSPKEIYGGLT